MFVDNKNQSGTMNPIQKYVHRNIEHHKISLILSIVVLVAFIIETFTGTSHFKPVQYLISFFFIIDFFYRLIVAKDRKKHIRLYWIDLFLCIPIYPADWFVVTMTVRAIKIVLEYVLLEINSAFNSMLIMGASLITFAMISITQFEILPECNIKGPIDAMWWALCTITTVGYGDKFPITPNGRIIATMLMISGIGLFGTLIGYMSTFFTDREKKSNNTIDTIEELSKQIDELKNEIKNIK